MKTYGINNRQSKDKKWTLSICILSISNASNQLKYVSCHGEKVGKSITAVCAQRIGCKAWELEQTVDSDIFVRTELTSSKLAFREKQITAQ